MIREHSSVVLTEAIPSAGLEAGDVGVVVHVHRNGERVGYADRDIEEDRIQ